MSIGNPKDPIIRNVINPITALADEANATDDLADFIRRAGSVEGIVWGRVAGVPLEQLVDPSRILDDDARIATEVQTVKPGGFYDILVKSTKDEPARTINNKKRKKK